MISALTLTTLLLCSSTALASSSSSSHHQLQRRDDASTAVTATSALSFLNAHITTSCKTTCQPMSDAITSCAQVVGQAQIAACACSTDALTALLSCAACLAADPTLATVAKTVVLDYNGFVNLCTKEGLASVTATVAVVSNTNTSPVAATGSLLPALSGSGAAATSAAAPVVVAAAASTTAAPLAAAVAPTTMAVAAASTSAVGAKNAATGAIRISASAVAAVAAAVVFLL